MAALPSIDILELSISPTNKGLLSLEATAGRGVRSMVLTLGGNLGGSTDEELVPRRWYPQAQMEGR